MYIPFNLRVYIIPSQRTRYFACTVGRVQRTFCFEAEPGRCHGNGGSTPSMTHAQRNLFKVLLNQPEIRLYLPFSD